MPDYIGALSNPSHLKDLKESVDGLAQIAQGAQTSSEPPPKADIENPMDKKEYTFSITHTAPRGQNFNGTFVNKILTIGEKIRVGVMRSRMGQGLDLASIDVQSFNLMHMLSWMSYSLQQKPQWAEDLAAIDDDRLIKKIYDVVDAHERRYHQLGERDAASTPKAPD